MEKEDCGGKQRKWTIVFSLIGDALLTAFLALSAFVFFSSFWLSDVFPDLLLDELVYHMKAPLTGTSPEMLSYYFTHYGIPEILVTAVSALLLFYSRRSTAPLHRWHGPIAAGVAVLCIVGIGGAVAHMDRRFGLISYARQQTQSDSFIEENYADPSSVEITFPLKKRNLIYIYIESAETAFADTETGGAFEKNCIPELTELALENECFNGGSGKLNGAVSVSGTGWTMGAIFGQSSGLPLKVKINGNDMSTQDSFFPSVTALGDILEDAGYTNVSLMGSDGEFAGEQLFFSSHGNYRMLDLRYAREEGWIPAQYSVWWGYEDEKLFSFAKRQLSELAEKDAPFNLTIQTIDTHSEDGYICELCSDEFGEDQYANVFACSSRQIAEFVRWVQSQDYYEDTTIVLVGDHPTMDSDFCDGVPASYQRRVFTAIINGAPAQQGSGQVRNYSSFDLFPTTLAALGVRIEGDRLGLGTDLYSDTQTLLERYGLTECERRLSARSEFMESLNQTVLTDALVEVLSYEASVTKTYGFGGNVSIHAQTGFDFRKIDDVSGVELEYWDLEAPDAEHIVTPMKRFSKDRGQYVKVTLNKNGYTNLATAIRIVKKDGSTVRLFGVLCSDDICEYLARAREGNNIVFIAVNDEASASVNNDIAAQLNQLGAKLDLHDHYRAGYILVSDSSGNTSEPVYEEFSENSVVTVSGEICGVTYCIESAGFNCGSNASIVIDGVERAVNGRGLNIVVFDCTQGVVVDSVCFDTHAKEITAMR